MKLLFLAGAMLALAGCAHPPQLATTVSIQKKSDSLVLVTLKVTNTEDRVTVPINVELTGQSRADGRWTPVTSLLHPAAFVLNRKEQREITKLWRINADAVRTTIVIKEQENGHMLKSEKFQQVFAGAPAAQE